MVFSVAGVAAAPPFDVGTPSKERSAVVCSCYGFADGLPFSFVVGLGVDVHVDDVAGRRAVLRVHDEGFELEGV